MKLTINNIYQYFYNICYLDYKKLENLFIDKNLDYFEIENLLSNDLSDKFNSFNQFIIYYF